MTWRGSASRRRRQHGELIVQQSFPRPRATTNPYLVMLAESIAGQPRVSLRTFSWQTALFGSYDVFHVHWPEILVTGGSSLKSFGRQVLTVALLVRLRMTGVPIVRTAHNPAPHSGVSRLAARVLAAVDAQTALWIHLNDETAVGRDRTSVVILHGHYRTWFARSLKSHESTPVVPGRLAFVGLIRPYKGVESLVEVFSSLARGGSAGVRPTLHVAGSPRTAQIARRLEYLASLDERVSLDLRYLDDRELVDAISAAELVVLPYRDMQNSGSALAALSLNRPVLVPANEVNRRLSEEVGPGWVYEFEHPLTVETLECTLARAHSDRSEHSAHSEHLARSDRPEHPNLAAREWADVGARHVDAYRRAIELEAARRGRA